MKSLFIKSALILAVSMSAAVAGESDDSYLWLEQVEGEKALTWVKQQNKQSTELLTNLPNYKLLYNNSLEILNDKTRIPYASAMGDYYYNFWKDENNTRGIYRRTTLTEYKKSEPKWETVLDVDALAKAENENWVYKGMNCYYPAYERCIVSLSRGGADATVIREFNLKTKSFVDGGFELPEAKSSISWYDDNHLFVGTDFGEGSLTDSGYPRIVKLWQRGKDINTAKTIYEANKTSVAAGGYTIHDGDTKVHLVQDATTFYTSDSYVLQQDKLIKLAIPADASISGLYQGNVFVELKSDWQGFVQGEVIYTSLDLLLANKAKFTSFFKPTETVSISSINFTKSAILVTVMDNVKDVLYRYQLDDKNQWQAQQVGFDVNGSVSVFNTNTDKDDFFVTYTSFLEPATLYLVDGNTLAIDKVKGAPAKFDASKYQTQQYFATSKDGTKVPYFVVKSKDIELNGKNPTLLYGYGGFEVSLQPYYSATTGKNWLELGGVYVLSNIRGGGEYGPRWHQAALKKNRHKAYEDFEAIAEDLIKRKITSPKHLGIQGGSNGGLLMGAAFTRRPDLYNAVVCQVPLLDMKRFNKLLAGASWMGEYGNPDIADEWDYIKTYSPYHNLSKDTQYPKVLFTTSTRDDRVHPAHARKMVAKMKDMGHDVLYFENTEGGHAGAANNEQRAMMSSLVYAYLFERLSSN